MSATVTVSEALGHARLLLREDPRLAAEQAREIVLADPDNADAWRLLGTALRRTGDDDDAGEAELRAISASVHDKDLMEAAQALARDDLPVAEALVHARRLLRDEPRLAAEQAREIVRADPGNADAWRLLGAALRRGGEESEAEEAELRAISASVHDPRLMEAAQALAANDLPVAERLLRPHLKEKPTDVAAIRMMAELAARLGRYGDAENLLRRAVELAPAFSAARANLATVLYRQNRPAEAIEALDALADSDSGNPVHQNLRAAALGRIGGYEEAISIYEQVLERLPDLPKVWMS